MPNTNKPTKMKQVWMTSNNGICFSYYPLEDRNNLYVMFGNGSRESVEDAPDDYFSHQIETNEPILSGCKFCGSKPTWQGSYYECSAVDCCFRSSKGKSLLEQQLNWEKANR